MGIIFVIFFPLENRLLLCQIVDYGHGKGFCLLISSSVDTVLMQEAM